VISVCALTLHLEAEEHLRIRMNAIKHKVLIMAGKGGLIVADSSGAVSHQTHTHTDFFLFPKVLESRV
jgi:hypothetical protein